MDNFVTGCMWYGVIVFLSYGAIFSDGDMGGRVSAGACALLMVFASWSLRGGKTAKIDVSVKNKIVAHDGNGRFLVEAKTSRQITGPRPYVEGNLPAHLTQVKKGLWVVNNGPYEHNAFEKTEWLPVHGDYRIEPRGNTATPGALADMMGGWDHNYIHKDDQQ
jgi:hypothetical protein